MLCKVRNLINVIVSELPGGLELLAKFKALPGTVVYPGYIYIYICMYVCMYVCINVLVLQVLGHVFDITDSHISITHAEAYLQSWGAGLAKGLQYNEQCVFLYELLCGKVAGIIIDKIIEGLLLVSIKI